MAVTVSPMTKQMHKKAAEQEHKREVRGNMLPVVNYKIEAHYDKKTDKRQADGSITHIFIMLAYTLLNH